MVYKRTLHTAKVSLVLAFALAIVVSFIFPLLSTDSKAAGVGVTVSAPADAEFPASTETDVTFGYTTSATEYANADVITVEIAPAVAAAVAGCTSPTTDIDTDTTTDGAFGTFTTTGAVYTLTAATTTASSTGVDLCLKFPATTATGIYSIAITDDNDNDFGAALVYVGDDNDVTVTAAVQPLLSFAIRNTADNGDTNTCDLGVLDTTTVFTCSYRLKPSTNSASGYTVQINSDGDLRSSGSGDVADSLDIDLVTEDTTVTAGTEDYGIAFVGGAATGGNITESGDFNDDDTPIPISSATNIYTSDGPNNPTSTDTTNTALVTHRAAMDFDTLTGTYSQIVTYYVSASF